MFGWALLSIYLQSDLYERSDVETAVLSVEREKKIVNGRTREQVDAVVRWRSLFVSQRCKVIQVQRSYSFLLPLILTQGLSDVGLEEEEAMKGRLYS